MPSTHPRSEPAIEHRFTKKLKTSHVNKEQPRSISSYFADGVLDATNAVNLGAKYRESNPFLYAVVDKLFQDDLLSQVKDECIGELSFTEKETDIYKVHQTGDLASLSYLAQAEIALLPNLLKLRDALYSSEFRDFIRKVTGCGPLSGTKQDMSVNSYKKGCHLLNHDDVIGSRCVSYILYMPMPQTEDWKPEWGGALELYPVKPGPDGILEPESIPSKSIPPSWNQFVFFEVQPGRSFHSVEEVTIDEGDCARQRLSISGWFHKAQEGEEGYEGKVEDTFKSSLEQLTSTSTLYTSYPDMEELLRSEPFAPLTEEQRSYLSVFLDPIYLQPKVMANLAKRFVDESSLELHKFLREPLASKLEAGLRAQDKKDGLDGKSRQGRIPPHYSGVDKDGESLWRLRGPPHKARYCSLTPSPAKNEEEAVTIVSSPNATPEQLLHVLETSLFPSKAFRSWLAHVSKLLPTRYASEARRFRPGLDYTLATSNDEQSILDVVLGLTPEAESSESNADTMRWDKGECGGWECYMAPHDGDEDPAVYRAGSSKKRGPEDEPKNSNGAATASNGNGNGHTNGHTNGHAVDEDEDLSDEEDDEDEEDDGTLLTVQPGFNRLALALRDEGVLRFVKYVSASAPGSRWDVCGEYEVFMTEEDDSDESDS